VILLALILQGGCFPTFENALPVPQGLRVDEEILGAWICPEKPGKGEVLLVFPRSNGWVNIYYFEYDAGSQRGGSFSLACEGYTVDVKKERFLCYRYLKEPSWDGQGEKPKREPFRIARYAINAKGNLEVDLFSRNAVKELVEKGTLKGTVTVRQRKFDNPEPEVHVTSSSEELLKALTELGPSRFINGKAWVLQRFDHKHLLR
jgi:hypothetical protein